ncbi:hypothetical protein ACFLTQ_02050 [Chloroflexota bacterium]
MKKLSAILLLFVLLLSTVVVATSCESGESSTTPTGTVNELFDAMEDMDVTKMMECMDISVSSQERSQVEATFQMMKEMGMSFSITNRDISVISETEDSAAVSAKCDIKATVMGQTQTQSMDETFDLVKVDGKWLLTGFPEEL